ncbi:Uncharacterized protein DBV15_12002 [Temnothorax longispinosus]|uniref:Uncharacterized protein n=1 Tax=Temnothorax longispinosus TaxID=300112 RepID=A0A4S2KX48_9HYME|nr:Uncharacterized protein DBV15_12002 [Temnothorax longispinosus]
MNNSQPRPAIQIATEYFVDQENCYYLILLHINAAVCIGATAMVATGTMLMTYLKHICGMFSIASYRIEKAMTINMQQNVNEEKVVIIYKEIICAIDIHRKATEFPQFLIKDFEGSFFFLILAGMISSSSTLVQVSLIFFLLKLCFYKKYNTQWYVAPLQIQKMILFLLQRGTKGFTMNIAGLYVASLEGAATVREIFFKICVTCTYFK